MKQQGGDDQDRISGLRGLRDVVPPPSLVPGVMQRIAERPAPGFWSWLRRPRRFEVRLSPMTFASATGALGLALFVVTQAWSPRQETVFVTRTPTAAPQETYVVRFVLVAKGAKKVSLAGDFNGWSPETTVLEHADGQGTFAATIRLPPGSHEYMFVVDGAWITDPAAAERRPDGFGRTNAVLRL